jgi:acyl dehydratase
MAERHAVHLDSPPSITTLYARALAGFGSSAVRGLPLVGDMPGLSLLPGFGERRDSLPDTELVLSDVQVPAAHLHQYDQVCGFWGGDRLPLTYPHVLAFPLSMELMTAASFPFPVIGLVHIENRITQHRPLLLSDKLAVSVWAQDLREHKRGTQFDIGAAVGIGDDVVWESRSTYLHREASGERSPEGGSRERDDDSNPTDPDIHAHWDIPDDVGRRYAAVSGDRNPIHMHSLAARLFGMPRAIAHGMWLTARCLAALEDHLPDAATVRASFKLPLLLPARVAFASWMAADERRFSVRDAESAKPHLAAELTQA